MEQYPIEGFVGVRSDDGQFFKAHISEFEEKSLPKDIESDFAPLTVSPLKEYRLTKYGVTMTVILLEWAGGHHDFIVSVRGGTLIMHNLHVKGDLT